MNVVEGIYQVQLPLPFPLRIVNSYVLRDGDGWTLIDAGINYPAGQAAWRAALAELGITPAAVRRIILTHAHPDHYGMAGWLAAQSGARVLLAPGEQQFAQRVWQNGAANERLVTSFFIGHGMPEPLAEQVRLSMAATRPMTEPWPVTTTLAPGTAIEIGQRVFLAIATPGHSEEHLVFYCAADRLLLCGDAVLTRITPNVSLWPNGRPNPLADFLRSLELLAELDVELALPGHGPLITAFDARLSQLRAHHDERLSAVEQAVGSGATAFAACRSVFPTETLSPHQVRFAMAETLAHLEYLVDIGRLERVEGGHVAYRRRM